MELGLDGKVAVVTAASLGLGRAMAEEFAREGAKVAICARREGPLAEAAQVLEAAGAEVFAEPADMTDAAAIARFIEGAAAALGGIDILVNNAGDAAVGHTVEDADEVWAETYTINLWSALRATRAAVPHIRARGGGSIVNIASVSGHSGIGGMADYNSAKAAMLAMTKTLAQDLAGDNIRVNAVNPALIHTPLWERIAADNFVGEVGESVDEVFDTLAKQFLLIPRYGRPDEVSGVVAFLASERASFVTGACWNVDGGFTKFLT